MAQPRTTFHLLKDFRPGADASSQLSDLRAQLAQVPDLRGAQLSAQGASTVVASLPAANQRERNKLKSLLSKSVRGWKVIDEVSHRLPTTF